jgi:6-pyruvoyl-tetrahydropterin synthase
MKHTYSRTVTFPASHFNGEEQYKTYWRLLDGYRGDAALSDCMPFITGLLKGCHGHNFRATITIQADALPEGMRPWLIDDEALAALVNEWSNTNLSIHDDFVGMRVRATTELMAETLLRKIYDRFLVPQHFRVTVSIQENDEITATASALCIWSWEI